MPSSEALKALDRWCRFLGLGDPRARLWCVGIEEGGEPHEDPLAILANDYERILGVSIDCTHDCPGAGTSAHAASKTTDVWRLSAQLAAKVFSIDEARVVQTLGTANSPVFLSNAYPLARPNTQRGWPYESYFTRSSYGAFVESLRPGLLGTVRKALSPESVVVGHGSSVWHLHRLAFSQGDESPEQLWDGKLRIYRGSRLILAPFFSRRNLSNKEVGQIASIIQGVL